MESSLSCLSSLKEDDTPVYIQPHYKESYRLAIYALLCGGTEAYEEFLQAEQISHFLSEREIAFILENAELPVIEENGEGRHVSEENALSTYFPTESDEEVPDLDLGWPEVLLEETDTSISVLFNPPRPNTPSIKEVIRKQIQEARQVIALAMDVFTDVDIFKEIITAALRGVGVYILLDESQFGSFLSMSHRVGVNLHDLKNIRVRTVKGLQYQCQSAMKFHGGMEQKFILIDCRTVLYGTYSYTWTFEKLNLSMVLVVTGQLVTSYDEEFRRLYARSTVPPLTSRERLQAVPNLRDHKSLNSPNSSQLSLHQLHMKNRAMNGMRSVQDDHFNNNMLTRGLSVQERLQHFPEMGNLVRGHSYGGELQKFNSMTRLRMGTKDLGLDRPGANLRPHDSMVQNRSAQQHLRHQSRYGPDHNLIPFNSETSLNRWKMDTYLNEMNRPLDASYEALSPAVSPYSSYTGLNELQSQMIHMRSKDIRARMEETRQKRLSLQEYANLRQSQESLRTTFPAQERSGKVRYTSRGMELRQSAAELEAFARQNDNTHKKEGDKREHVLTNGQRSASHQDFKTLADRKMQTHDWYEPISRSTSASELDLKLNDPHKLGLGLQHQRPMESLTEIPEEKESNSRVNSSDLVPEKAESSEVFKDGQAVPKNSQEHKDLVKEPQKPTGKVDNSLGSAAQKESEKSTPNGAENVPKITNTSVGSQQTSETKQSQAEKQKDTPTLQRKNSVRSKVCSMLSTDEKKSTKKEDKPLQRRSSLRSQKTSGSLKTDSSLGSIAGKQSAPEQTAKKGQSPNISRSQKSATSPTETDKPKAPFPMNRFSPQRSSKRKTTSGGEDSDRGSRSTINDEGGTSFEARKEKAYSRYEYLLGKEEKNSRGVYFSEDDRSASPNRRDAGYQGYQTQAGADNKIGRFMQRVGNLIGNKSK